MDTVPETQKTRNIGAFPVRKCHARDEAVVSGNFSGEEDQFLSISWVCLKMSKQFGDLLSTSCHEIMEDMVNMMIKHQMLGARIAAPFEKSGSIGK